MINLMQMGLDIQAMQAAANQSVVSQIRYVDPSRPLATLQNEALYAGLILQINKQTGQKLMSDKLLKGFEPVRSGYKNEPVEPEAA